MIRTPAPRWPARRPGRRGPRRPPRRRSGPRRIPRSGRPRSPRGLRAWWSASGWGRRPQGTRTGGGRAAGTAGTGHDQPGRPRRCRRSGAPVVRDRPRPPGLERRGAQVLGSLEHLDGWVPEAMPTEFPAAGYARNPSAPVCGRRPRRRATLAEGDVCGEVTLVADHDVVIVGAGSAGCVLAARLSQDPNCSVTLLEAGPDYPDPATLPPEIASGRSPAFTHDWGYRSEPGTLDRALDLHRGRLA